jgi:hypothetical protein
MKISYVALAAVFAATSVAALAEDGQGEQPQQERRICRTEKMTGSLTRRTRICLTEAQWRELNARTRKGVDEMAGTASGSQEVDRSAERTGL